MGHGAAFVSLPFLLGACGELSRALDRPAPAAARIAKENGGSAPALEPWAKVPVPPADGPALAPLALVVPIQPRPSGQEQPVGYLRVGARPPRSFDPVSKEGCPGGWYAVRPVGYVCANELATTDLEHPVARAFRTEPNRAEPMPYRYAFLRSISPNYLRVPTKAEQAEREMFVDRQLRSYAKMAKIWDKLDVGANDMPLGADGLPNGPIPEDAKPLGLNERYGGTGDDAVPWWLEGGQRKIPNISAFKAPPFAVIAGRSKRHAGMALIGSFVADAKANSRRFAIATDGRIFPADRLKAEAGSTFHGRDIREVGLPVAFMRHAGARYWKYEGGQLLPGDKLEWREFVPLTGKVTSFRGERMVEARDGRWVKSDELRVAARPTELPSWAKRGQRWVEIGLIGQTLVLWEGTQPVFATLISSGKDGLGEPKKTLSTPRGTFRVYQKHVTTTMDSEVADHEFELRDVPWVMYFQGGYALHGAYWHDDFGKPRSHGCVNLAPIDARYVFGFVDPPVPDHWHAGYASDALGKGTIVHIHP